MGNYGLILSVKPDSHRKHLELATNAKAQPSPKCFSLPSSRLSAVPVMLRSASRWGWNAAQRSAPGAEGTSAQGDVGELEHPLTCCCLLHFPEEEALLQEEPGGREEAPQVVDLEQLVPVGGVFHISALQLPPQAQDVGDWTMVEVREDRDQPRCPRGAAPEVCHCCHMRCTRVPDSKLTRQVCKSSVFHVGKVEAQWYQNPLLVQLQALQAG